MNIQIFFRTLLQVLIALPQEIPLALWRLFLAMLLLLLLLLRALWCLLLRLFGKRCEKPKDPCDCGNIPPHIKRKPDPCLYDQFYLIAQGYSVTWDNPDIWITLPDGTPVNSYDLLGNTDYLVNAQIHDASFDPALATQVRCYYRPWSFNSPNRVPVETNPDNTAKVVILHIPPWSQKIAQFHWHTPAALGHYCLQVECYHPDDKNPNNNLGQENTQIVGGSAGQVIHVEAMLFNRVENARGIRITADQYRIPNGEFDLKLATRILPLRRGKPFDAVYNLLLRRAARGSPKTQNAFAPAWISYAYRGWDQARKGNARGQFPIRAPWNVRVNATDVTEGRPGELVLDPKQAVAVPIEVHIPAGAAVGTQQTLNLTACAESGKVLGGVTLQVEVRP